MPALSREKYINPSIGSTQTSYRERIVPLKGWHRHDNALRKAVAAHFSGQNFFRVLGMVDFLASVASEECHSKYDQPNKVRITLDEIARETGSSKSQVQRLLKMCKQAHLIWYATTNAPGEGNLYTLLDVSEYHENTEVSETQVYTGEQTHSLTLVGSDYSTTPTVVESDHSCVAQTASSTALKGNLKNLVKKESEKNPSREQEDFFTLTDQLNLCLYELTKTYTNPNISMTFWNLYLENKDLISLPQYIDLIKEAVTPAKKKIQQNNLRSTPVAYFYGVVRGEIKKRTGTNNLSFLPQPSTVETRDVATHQSLLPPSSSPTHSGVGDISHITGGGNSEAPEPEEEGSLPEFVTRALSCREGKAWESARVIVSGRYPAARGVLSSIYASGIYMEMADSGEFMDRYLLLSGLTFDILEPPAWVDALTQEFSKLVGHDILLATY